MSRDIYEPMINNIRENEERLYIENLERLMEEMAGKPAERHIRRPGEIGSYEKYTMKILDKNDTTDVKES